MRLLGQLIGAGIMTPRRTHRLQAGPGRGALQRGVAARLLALLRRRAGLHSAAPHPPMQPPRPIRLLQLCHRGACPRSMLLLLRLPCQPSNPPAATAAWPAAVAVPATQLPQPVLQRTGSALKVTCGSGSLGVSLTHIVQLRAQQNITSCCWRTCTVKGPDRTRFTSASWTASPAVANQLSHRVATYYQPARATFALDRSLHVCLGKHYERRLNLRLV